MSKNIHWLVQNSLEGKNVPQNFFFAVYKKLKYKQSIHKYIFLKIGEKTVGN